jgi:oligopeptidase B
MSYPNKPTEVWDLHDVRPILTFPQPVALPYFVHGFATSKDGTRIPYTIVAASPRPVKLVVEAYGAYGISGHRAYPVKWLSYLERGYAVAFLFPRGGRENGDAWWLSGSTATKKHHTFEDVYATIRAVQHRLRIPVGKTIFYGRSAGGWVAARVAQREPSLAAAVLAEVPYVDVLRTTSNPRLPLTQMEYDEFGDPRRPADYAALLRISPVDTVSHGGSTVVLVRTALHDMEVSPYEAVKWVTKLQSKGWDAVLALDRDGGHFAASTKSVEQAAENAAFLDGVLSHRGTRKAKSHTSRGRTSNSTRRRKH